MKKIAWLVLPPPKDVEHGARFISQAEAYLGDAEKACLEFNDMAWAQMLFTTTLRRWKQNSTAFPNTIPMSK